jgi:hypothetical protein
MVDCRHPFLTLSCFAPNVKLFHLPVPKDIRKIAAIVYSFRKIKYDECNCARYLIEERSKNGRHHGLAFGHTKSNKGPHADSGQAHVGTRVIYVCLYAGRLYCLINNLYVCNPFVMGRRAASLTIWNSKLHTSHHRS